MIRQLGWIIYHLCAFDGIETILPMLTFSWLPLYYVVI
jgi:hypothetical protein